MKFMSDAYIKRYFETMTRYKRIGKGGKVLLCPNCKDFFRAYHLRFLSVRCNGCKKMIPKYEWLIEISKNKK